MKRRFTSERIVWIFMFKPFFLDAFRKHYLLNIQPWASSKNFHSHEWISYSHWEWKNFIDLDEKLHVDSRICIFGTPVELIITQQGPVEKCRFFITVGRAHAPEGINFYSAIYVSKALKIILRGRKSDLKRPRGHESSTKATSYSSCPGENLWPPRGHGEPNEWNDPWFHN